MTKQDFSGQQSGEVVNFIFRRHPSVLLTGAVKAGVILAVTVLPLILWHDQVWTWYLVLGGLVAASLLLFNAWIKWYYSIYIVTNLRVRQQIQTGLFRKTAIDLYLNKIQNISYNISGLLGSMMDYGTIVLQTVVGDMIMTKVNQCEEVHDQLSAAVQTAGGPIDQGEYDQTEGKNDEY